MFFIKWLCYIILNFAVICLVFSIPSYHEKHMSELIAAGMIIINYIVLIKCYKWKEYQMQAYWIIAYIGDILLTTSVIYIIAGGGQ